MRTAHDLLSTIYKTYGPLRAIQAYKMLVERARTYDQHVEIERACAIIRCETKIDNQILKEFGEFIKDQDRTKTIVMV